MKRLFTIILALCMLTILINARTFNEPSFVNTDMHVNRMIDVGTAANDLPVLYATVLQNYSEKITFYPLMDGYNYRSDDIIYLYEKNMNFSVEANHITLIDNEFSFSLNKILKGEEKVGVILDYGTTTKFVTGKDITYYYNQYHISDVYADDYVNVKIVIYIEKVESNTIARYGQVIEKYLIPAEYPSSYNEIYSFRLPGQIGATVIDRAAKIIRINVNNSVDITELIPSVIHSPRASIYPDISQPRDFSKQVVYRIVAENNNSTNYTVIVTVVKPQPVNPLPWYYYPGYNIPGYPPPFAVLPPYYYHPVWPPVYPVIPVLPIWPPN